MKAWDVSSLISSAQWCSDLGNMSVTRPPLCPGRRPEDRTQLGHLPFVPTQAVPVFMGAITWENPLPLQMQRVLGRGGWLQVNDQIKICESKQVKK